MATAICAKIVDFSSNQARSSIEELPDLILSGHSAGGGVAALLCAHIRRCRPDIQKVFHQIHCISFAAPPVFAPLQDDTEARSIDPKDPLTLSLVHFGDIVPRAETGYIRSLLQLYEERAERLSEDPWQFGAPTLFNYGKVVVFQDISDDVGEQDVRAMIPTQDVWQNLAFGNVKAHSMDGYLEALKIHVLSLETRPPD